MAERDLDRDIQAIRELVNKPDTRSYCTEYDMQEELERVIESQPLIMREHVRSVINHVMHRAREEGILAGLKYANGEEEVQIGNDSMELLIEQGLTEINMRKFFDTKNKNL